MPTENQVLMSALTDIDTYDKETVGTVRVVGSKRYKYCLIKNTTATVAGALGSFVSYGGTNGYNSNLVVIDQSDADSVPIPAGTLQGTVTGTLATSYYGWVQTHGYATLDTALAGSPAAGNGLFVTGAATDKQLTKAVEADSAAAYRTVAAIAVDVTNKIVLLTCPN